MQHFFQIASYVKGRFDDHAGNVRRDQVFMFVTLAFSFIGKTRNPGSR